MSNKIWVATWQRSGESPEFSLHQSEGGAIQSLVEEVEDFMGDESFSFDPEEYNDLLAGEQIDFTDVDSDKDPYHLWVGMKLIDVLA